MLDLDLAQQLFLGFHRSNHCLQPRGNAFVSHKIYPVFFAWTGNCLFLNVMNLSSFKFTFFKQTFGFCIVQVSCNHNSNPLFCANRKSNQKTALLVLHHFTLCGIVVGSFVSYRGVIIVATMGSTAVQKHVCRPCRNPSPPAMRPPARMGQ